MRGGLYFDRFDKDPKITKVGVTNEIQLLKMLDVGRYDIIIGNDLNIDYLIHRHGFSGKFEKAPFKVDSFTPTYIAISKKSKFIDVIPRLGVALKNMIESKRIEEIEQTYMKKFKAN
ncbi:MAG TPA: transporter substrate-binding domain-containing protein [Candidatus Aminicenantes bacterium]|nr:transporter substrate-binding domain-containing protein [Candidatus Aminicenantes bacterium]